MGRECLLCYLAIDMIKHILMRWMTCSHFILTHVSAVVLLRVMIKMSMFRCEHSYSHLSSLKTHRGKSSQNLIPLYLNHILLKFYAHLPNTRSAKDETSHTHFPYSFPSMTVATIDDICYCILLQQIFRH